MEIKYLIGGEAVRVIEHLKNGFLVSHLYESFDDDEPMEDGTPFVVKKIYDSPPVQIYNEKINNLKKQIDEKTTYLNSINGEIRQREKELKVFAESRNKYPELDLILDIAEGKKIIIVNLNNLLIKTYPDDYPHDKLFKSVSWQSCHSDGCYKMKLFLGSYSDTSGSLYDIVAFKTTEDAIKFIQQRIEEELNNDKINAWNIDNMLKAAIAIGYTSNIVEKHKSERLTTKKESTLKEINDLRKKIDALNETIA